MSVIFPRFEYEGKAVLGVDTGLTPDAFGKLRYSSLLALTGCLFEVRGGSVGTDFEVRQDEWRPSGVTERAGGAGAVSMVIYGPDVLPGAKRLDEILRTDDGDAKLAALRLWAQCVRFVPENLAPCNALIDASSGRVLILPHEIVETAFLNNEPERLLAVDSWTAPDLDPEKNPGKALDFCFAVMLYTVFAGRNPFLTENGEGLKVPDASTLHTDQREGVFLPLRLAAPGLDKTIAEKIEAELHRGMSEKSPTHRYTAELSTKKNTESREKARLLELIGSLAQCLSFYFTPLNNEEKTELEAEKLKYAKRQRNNVEFKRQMTRNKNIIIGIAVFAAVFILAASSIVGSILRAPTTKGMDPVQVAEAYYKAYSGLNQDWMQACLWKGAGKTDYDAATNLYVTSKVRQAYERTVRLITPEEYIKEGSKPNGNQIVWGIPQQGDGALKVEQLSKNGSEAKVEAEYTLWYPGMYDQTQEQADAAQKEEEKGINPAPVAPAEEKRTDTLTLRLDNKNWRITAIDRQLR
jgi:hypothetical protein